MEGFVERFTCLVQRGERDLDLAEAALVIGSGGDPAFDPSRWLAEIEHLSDGLDTADDLVHRLFLELGFAGNTEDFYDPENSFLHRVIERRRGVPITLSVLSIEVGRRAGIDLQGVGMPGHFLLRDPASRRYLDVFHGGEVVDEAACERLFREATGAGPETPFVPELLAPVGRLATLARILANLKVIYQVRQSPRDLERVLRMRLALPDVPAAEVIQLGEALAMQGRFLEGAQEIEARVGRDPDLDGPFTAAANALRSRLN